MGKFNVSKVIQKTHRHFRDTTPASQRSPWEDPTAHPGEEHSKVPPAPTTRPPAGSHPKTPGMSTERRIAAYRQQHMLVNGTPHPLDFTPRQQRRLVKKHLAAGRDWGVIADVLICRIARNPRKAPLSGAKQALGLLEAEQ